MTLAELKIAVDRATDLAKEIGDNPDQIPVFLQLDRWDKDSLFTGHEVDVHYDGGAQATGCVIAGFLDEPTAPPLTN